MTCQHKHATRSAITVSVEQLSERFIEAADPDEKQPQQHRDNKREEHSQQNDVKSRRRPGQEELCIPAKEIQKGCATASTNRTTVEIITSSELVSSTPVFA